ncbi:glycosyl transferase family 2 [Rhodobacter sp. JA431]|uniref:glycosyltransferase family 2 protein n=1 Tax=Rhodobacter sp. JA431 TaxID=570013 RepID=UPI000BD5DC51|nr:glycosyltransferase family 2 protein [Rhodobacter sp. JA431]SOC10049.1 glycosyl transferase family 2 [Rhodobacter sp. JA431]
MVSWAVVAMADEPASLLAAWAGHHLEMGAAEVHLCLDRPNPEAVALLSGGKGVHLHEDGEDAWAFRSVGRRPKTQNGRQKYHASRILAKTRADWLLHCDADEFLFPTPVGETVERILARIEPDKTWVQALVAERVRVRGRPVQDIFSGVFRLPWERFETEGAALYGAEAGELLHHGLSGHHMGKAMVRAGRGLFVGVHHALTRYDPPERDPNLVPAAGLRVLHFDGLTELHYLLKMLRYGLDPHFGKPDPHAGPRWRQISAVLDDVQAPERLELIHMAAKTITPAQAQGLAERILLRRWAPEIGARAATVIPNLPDLTPAAFDADLMAREAALLEALRLKLGFDPVPHLGQ